MGLFTFLGDVFTGGAYTANKTNQNIANQNLAYQRYANSQNIAFQKEENATTRLREDNAVQRAALDMQAAGLSKTLAAGNPASAQQLTAASVTPLHNNYQAQKLDIIGGALNLKAQYENIKNQMEQTKFIKEQATAQNIANQFVSEGLKLDLEGKKLKLDLDKSYLKLSNIEGDFKAEQLRVDIDKKLSEMNNTNMDTALKARQTAHEVAKANKLAYEQELLIEDIAYKKLQQEALQHDIDVARAGNTRTNGDSLSWWERLIRSFNIANGNQSVNLPHFDSETLGYDW